MDACVCNRSPSSVRARECALVGCKSSFQRLCFPRAAMRVVMRAATRLLVGECVRRLGAAFVGSRGSWDSASTTRRCLHQIRVLRGGACVLARAITTDTTEYMVVRLFSSSSPLPMYNHL